MWFQNKLVFVMSLKRLPQEKKKKSEKEPWINPSQLWISMSPWSFLSKGSFSGRGDLENNNNNTPKISTVFNRNSKGRKKITVWDKTKVSGGVGGEVINCKSRTFSLFVPFSFPVSHRNLHLYQGMVFTHLMGMEKLILQPSKEIRADRQPNKLPGHSQAGRHTLTRAEIIPPTFTVLSRFKRSNKKTLRRLSSSRQYLPVFFFCCSGFSDWWLF